MQSRRNTWSNRQIWPWNTEWNRAKSNRVLPRKCTGHSKHPLPTTQGKTLHMDFTRWSTLKSDWLYSLQSKMEKLYTISKNRTRSWCLTIIQCHKPLSILLQALCLSDLIPWIYFSLPLYNHKGFKSHLNGLVIFPTFFNLSLNLAIRNSWSEPHDLTSQLLVLFLLTV